MYKIRKALLYMALMVILFVPAMTKAGDSLSITNGEFVQLLQTLDTEGRLEGVEVKASEVALTRENAAILIVKLLGYEGIASEYKNSTTFTDVTAYKGEIHIMQELGVMSGVSAKAFAPTKPLTAKQAEVIIGRIQNKLAANTSWKHISYAISSNSQMELIKDYDAISFGWAELNYEEVSDTFSVSTALAGNDFKVPTGFQIPLDFAKANGVETYLMVYFEIKERWHKASYKISKKVTPLFLRL